MESHTTSGVRRQPDGSGYSATQTRGGALSESDGLDSHPRTHRWHSSPVLPGSGWPGDPATPRTQRAQSSAEVVQLARTASDQRELDARVSVCRACPRLVAWRERVAVERRASFADQPYWGRPVPSFGDPHAAVLIVGLAPAAQGGNRTGRVFTGDRSGDWLFAALHRAGYANQAESVDAADGLRLTGVRVLAAVRCAPPDNKPTTVERETCAPWLDRDLGLALPRLRSILALGGFAWTATLAAARRLGWAVPRPKPVFGHGAEAVLDAGERTVRLVGSYHVSQQNTFTGRLTEAMLDDVIGRL